MLVLWMLAKGSAGSTLSPCRYCHSLTRMRSANAFVNESCLALPIVSFIYQ